MKMKKRLFGILLSLALMLGLMPGMSLTAYADDDPPYAQYKNTTTVITFDGKTKDEILKEYRQLLNQMVNRAESFIGDRNEWKNGKITDDSIKEKYGPWVKGYFKSGGDFH